MATERRRRQIASNIKRILQDVLIRHLSDPRIRGMVTITDVEVTQDLREARVHVSVFPEKHESVTIRGLEAATLRIQKLVNKELVMRRPPHLSFVLDRTIKKQSEVLAAISRVVPPPDEDESEDDEDGDASPHRPACDDDHSDQ